MYAVIELKYDRGKFLLAKKTWLLKQQKVYNKTEDVFCYWSPDLNDSTEDINYEYSKKFTGEPGLFKVFVIKLADTLEEAEKALQGRVSMVAKRFREPANTDEEFKKIQAKRKKTEKKDLKTKQEEAHSMNIKYLVEEMKMQTPSVRQLSIDSQALAEDTLSILNPTPASPLTIHQLSKDSPASTAESISSIVTPKLVMSPTLRHSPKVSVVSIVDNNPTVLRKDSPTSIEASISSIVSPTLSFPSKVHNFPKISPTTTVDNIPTIMLPVVSTPKTIRYLSTNSHESVEEEVLSVESMTPEARNLSMDSPLSSLSTVQQPPALSEISFDLSSLGIPYDDILRDLFSEETQIGQNLFEHLENPDITSKTTVVTPKPLAEAEVKLSNKESEIITINYDELIQKNKELSLENQKLVETNQALKDELDCTKKRNDALQNHLVAMNERVPETLYVEKDGGRLYKGDVFLSKNQCLVLEKSKSDSEYLNNLLVCIFGRDALLHHSLTGRPSNRTKDPPKPALEKNQVKLVYEIMEARSIANKTKQLSKSQINSFIGKKLANVASYEKKKP